MNVRLISLIRSLGILSMIDSLSFRIFFLTLILLTSYSIINFYTVVEKFLSRNHIELGIDSSQN
jgi:hypothetical protein